MYGDQIKHDPRANCFFGGMGKRSLLVPLKTELFYGGLKAVTRLSLHRNLVTERSPIC